MTSPVVVSGKPAVHVVEAGIPLPPVRAQKPSIKRDLAALEVGHCLRLSYTLSRLGMASLYNRYLKPKKFTCRKVEVDGETFVRIWRIE